MAQTMRKEVHKPTDSINSLTSVTNSGAKVKGTLPDGSLHGLIHNLTMLGVGFNT